MDTVIGRKQSPRIPRHLIYVSFAIIMPLPYLDHGRAEHELVASQSSIAYSVLYRIKAVNGYRGAGTLRVRAYQCGKYCPVRDEVLREGVAGVDALRFEKPAALRTIAKKQLSMRPSHI